MAPCDIFRRQKNNGRQSMRYILMAALAIDVVLLFFLIRSVSETALGAHASRVVALLLACFVFYSPTAVLGSLPIPLHLAIADIGNRWIKIGIIAVFVVAIAYSLYLAWQKRVEEFRSVLSAGWRFAAIGVLALAARVLIPRVLRG
jgi:hypothetical protein